MKGRIKWLNQHPEAIMLMVQQQMCVPFTIIKLITSQTLRHKRFIIVWSEFLKENSGLQGFDNRVELAI